ncbi:MAG: gamma-glutamyl-phosphate reductase, partial [Pseudomonadota bacterium]
MLDDRKTDIPTLMREIGQRARAAAVLLATASAERKHAALIAAAEALMRRRSEILDANALDMAYGEEKGLSAAMLDRLALNDDRIAAMANGLLSIADAPDPVGAVISSCHRHH